MAARWFDPDDEHEGVLIARLLSKGSVPKALRRSTLLAAGDEALVLDSAHGKPIIGPKVLKTKDEMRGGADILIYSRTNTYEFEFEFEAWPATGDEPLSGKMCLGVRVSDDRPSLIRDRLLANFPEGECELPYADAHAIIERRLEGRWGQITEGLTIENRKEASRHEDANANARKVARDALSPLGLYVSEAGLEWYDSIEERARKKAHGTAASGTAVDRHARSLVRERARRQNTKIRLNRAEEELDAAKKKDDMETDFRLRRIENLGRLGDAHGIESE